MSSAFYFQNGLLQAEGLDASALADQVGTPFFCYSSKALLDAYEDYAGAFADARALICYAIKANSNQAVITTLARAGAGADVVSLGELKRALMAGVPPEKIVFAGVGKSEEEMAAAVETGIYQVNVESEEELARLNRVACDKGQSISYALRINPDVDAKTHAKITTGKAENKFGIAWDEASRIFNAAREMKGAQAAGVAMHIGSQITELAPYKEALARLVSLYVDLNKQGLGLTRIDVGGGLGVAYRDETPIPLKDYAQAVKAATQGVDADLVFEPGRRLVADAGVLITRVLYVKPGRAKSFVIVDAAMNDLIRPTLYEAWHPVFPLRQPDPEAPSQRVDIVGPVCESGDVLAHDRAMSPLAAGDLLAIGAAGAYGAVMSSSYNSRLLTPEVLVKGDLFAVVRPRPSYEALIGQDQPAPWLKA